MAAEVAIIASDLPCVREIIPDERYALLVPPQDVEAQVRGILWVWRDGADPLSTDLEVGPVND